MTKKQAESVSKGARPRKTQDIRLIPKVQTAEGWRRQRLQAQNKSKGKSRP